MAGAKADLRFLKQLALNSIEATAMNPVEKSEAREKWDTLWSSFLDRVISIYEPEYFEYAQNKSNFY
ncbi:unnamed protein product [Allacma fusca]|uniref:Uncharacterized protein n=1 Tax=Allacma fusca TaxID=39272 RepID=A0A8J2KZX7_9HEXA|nr:unnamed protein product [Allacma fusca]